MNAAVPGQKAPGRAASYAAWAFLAASPFLLLVGFSVLAGRNALQSVPVWTDELDYWRAVYTWLHAGLAAGCSGIGELAAALGPLSVHGITPLLLYALPATVFGWSFSSIVVYNALWISLGGTVFCALNRPKPAAALGMGLGLMLYAPAVLYCATSMTELANYGLLLFYLAFTVRLARVRHEARQALGAEPRLRTGLPSLLLASLTVLMCCLYRITYVGLWIPVGLAAFGRRVNRRTLAYWLAALVLSALAYTASTLLTSPYASGFLYNFLRTGSLGLSARMFLSHAKANLLDYFVHEPGSAMEGAQRILYCAVAVLALLHAFVSIAREGGRLRLRLRLDGLSLLTFLMLALPFAIVVCFYETNDWSDYRTLAPFLWLAAAAYLLRGRKLVTVAYFAGCALSLLVLLAAPSTGVFADTGRFAPAAVRPEAQALCDAIRFDGEAASPFDNAVRTDQFTLETLTALPPGMGVQSGWFTADTVGKSRWILTDYLKIPLEGYELVLKNAAGSVYRRVDAFRAQ